MKAKHVLLSLLGLVLFIGLILALDYSSLLWEGFIGPKRQNVRRKIFEETRSYNEAKYQDLVKYRLQYIQEKDPESKAALKSTILHMFANYDENKLPPELRNFLREIKYGGDKYTVE